MKISKQNRWLLCLLVVSIIISNQPDALAVSDYGNTSVQEYGDAVYRYLDAWGLGQLANYNHAGLFAGINGTDSYRVFHAASYINCVQDADFVAEFKNNPLYYGAYTHSSFTLDFAERKAIIQTARNLSAASIYYTLWNAIDPLTSARPITVNNIDNIRCDGVVEYCYESQGFWAWEPANDRGKRSILYNPEAHNDMPDLSMNPDTELSPWAQRGAPENTGPWHFGGTNPNNSYLNRSALIDLPTYEVTSWPDNDHMVIEIKSKDIKSGTHKIGYRLPGGSGWTYSRNVQHPSSDTYTQQYNVYSEGYFYYWAQDNGGNQPEYAEYVDVQFPIWYRDADGDGYGNPNNSRKSATKPSGYVSNSSDCDDTDSSIHPGATEVYDGKDNDCDGQIDEGMSNNTDHAPVLEAIGNKSVNENSILSFSISATDADGDTITYSAQNLPSGAAFAGQIFSWTPSYSQAGTYSVTFIASDGASQDSETITITVSNTNRAPVLAAIGNKEVNENFLLSFTVSATDADGDTIMYAAQGLPSGATFAGQSFNWTPSPSQAGTYQVTFIASDGQLQDSETISITVNNVN